MVLSGLLNVTAMWSLSDIGGFQAMSPLPCTPTWWVTPSICLVVLLLRQVPQGSGGWRGPDLTHRTRVSVAVSSFYPSMPDRQMGGHKEQTSLCSSLLYLGASRTQLPSKALNLPSLLHSLPLSFPSLVFTESLPRQVLECVLGCSCEQGRQESLSSWSMLSGGGVR